MSKQILLTFRSWTNHTARIQCICWLDDARFATGSLDRNVHIWDTEEPKSRTKLEGAHHAGCAARCAE